MNIDSDTMIYCITLQKSLEILCRTLVLIKSSDTQYIYILSFMIMYSLLRFVRGARHFGLWQKHRHVPRLMTDPLTSPI